MKLVTIGQMAIQIPLPKIRLVIVVKKIPWMTLADLFARA